MKIKEFQEAIADELNGVDELVQGGCKAFAEDSRSVFIESDQHVQNGKVAVVVVTPEMTRNGCSSDAIPAETQLLIQCSEKPMVARAQPGVITALDAAEIVMYALDGSQFRWLETRQTLDRQAGVLTATVTFATSMSFQECKV